MTFPGVPPHGQSVDQKAWFWITSPPGMVTELAPGATLTSELATFLSTTGDDEMRRRHPGEAHFFYLHDFARGANYDAEGRRLMIEWGKLRVREATAVILVPPLKMGTFTRMGVSAATSLLRVTGLNVEIAADAGAVIARFGLRPLELA